ncbi:MAG: transglycosylase SLT domain-containing protein [Crocinitomicaceae bacterium]
MYKLLLSSFLFVGVSALAQSDRDYSLEQVEVMMDNHNGVIMGAQELFASEWHALPQPQFWKQIMQLSPDTFLVNVAATRQILKKISVEEWSAQTNEQKELYKIEIRKEFGLAENEQLYVTSGKNDFYKFDAVYPQLSKGVEAFEKAGVDPWYAQAILLIESPGQMKKSRSGAYGAFQLMPGVARAQGLTVNKYVDERENFERSATGASRLISRICIPEAKVILENHNIEYDENEVWFRLFVLHIYHAGAGNVAAVMNKINPTQGGQELIKEMWQNTAAGFGNNSQNYTQLALASQLILHEIVEKQAERMYFCKYP